MSKRTKGLATGILLMAATAAGPAGAATIESLVMPGPLSAAHADLEAECAACHAAFDKALQRDLCLSCHEHRNILEDQASGSGFHGRFESARDVECAACHTEHEGSDADIVALDPETFDHGFTDFGLEGAHAALPCRACHAEGEPHRDAPSDCKSCHETIDPHGDDLGAPCGECHGQQTWRSAEFDHEKRTDFLLTGAHAELQCVHCHTQGHYADTPSECNDCHRADDIHAGMHGSQCRQCHSTGSWDESAFDHAEASGFALTGRHGEVACAGCHVGGTLPDSAPGTECLDCHAADDVHLGGNGTDCAACHDTAAWGGSGFSHTAKTEFPLRGAHAELACRACHAGGSRKSRPETACIGCHRVNDAHDATLGEDCARCHQESSWTDGIRFDHDLGRFPLIGLHAVVPCESCHSSQRFSEAPGDCAECHLADDAHRGSLGRACGDCHNPNDWALWSFDHDASTEFPLEGAHAELSCERCHGSGSQRSSKPPSTCYACHRGDDIHDGQFGRQCERCHVSRTFSDLETIQ